MITTRLIKLGSDFHAIVLDQQGEIHHEVFSGESQACIFIESFYHEHKCIVKYEV